MSWYRREGATSARARAAAIARHRDALRSKGRDLQPVSVAGRTIAKSFWGRAWCTNLERYSDYSNRLPRGRTYARNGSILDLHIRQGTLEALVSGSRLYEVNIAIDTLPDERWSAIRSACAGQIDSLVDLLQGQLSDGVMEVVSRAGTGLFPSPREIHLRCSCPDWAVMCKHVAAVLYGVGNRLDLAPELLFSLRGVDPSDLLEEAIGHGLTQRPPTVPVLPVDHALLGAIFGVDIDFSEDALAPPASPDPHELGERVIDALADRAGVSARVLAQTLQQPLANVLETLAELREQGFVYDEETASGELTWWLG